MSSALQGDIYVNGTPIDKIREWYIANTGYVLQLATPYYEELTVRENLTLAAQLKLPTSFTLREKFERIEQVMDVVSTFSVLYASCTQNLSCPQRIFLALPVKLHTNDNYNIYCESTLWGLIAVFSTHNTIIFCVMNHTDWFVETC